MARVSSATLPGSAPCAISSGSSTVLCMNLGSALRQGATTAQLTPRRTGPVAVKCQRGKPGGSLSSRQSSSRTADPCETSCVIGRHPALVDCVSNSLTAPSRLPEEAASATRSFRARLRGVGRKRASIHRIDPAQRRQLDTANAGGSAPRSSNHHRTPARATPPALPPQRAAPRVPTKARDHASRLAVSTPPDAAERAIRQCVTPRFWRRAGSSRLRGSSADNGIWNGFGHAIRPRSPAPQG